MSSKINKETVLNMLEANRFLAMMLERDGVKYNHMVVKNDGIHYTQQKPGLTKEQQKDVKKLVITFDEINEHLELEA